MTLNEFLNKCSESYSNISLFDKLFSSPFPFMIKLILYVLSAFILVCIGGFSGLRGWYLLTILFALFGIAGILTIKAFQKYQRGTPIRRKIFTYRISKLVESLGDYVEDIGEDKRSVVIKMFHYKHPLIINYHIDLLINAGGIILGTPVTIPKSLHPKTYFISIEGKSGRFHNDEINYDFSARVNDEDPVNGCGVRMYKIKKHFMKGKEHVRVDSNLPEALSFKNELGEAIQGTMIKGELEFNNGRFFLRLFDNISKMGHISGNLLYRKFKRYNKVKKNAFTEPKMAFYGVKNIIEMI